MKKPAQAGFFMPAAFMMLERTHYRLPDSQKMLAFADMPLHFLNSSWLKNRRTIG
ncbi:TPA: hypothetical protein HH703_000418 [Escherichia coli]|nr:hypothetical protein [Escherichia coli]